MIKQMTSNEPYYGFDLFYFSNFPENVIRKKPTFDSPIQSEWLNNFVNPIGKSKCIRKVTTSSQCSKETSQQGDSVPCELK